MSASVIAKKSGVVFAACTSQVGDESLATTESAATGSIPCGESSCTPVTGTRFGSHFAEPNCTGREYYYTPYFSNTTQPNPDKIRHTWDGQGLSGNAYRTVAVRSFKDAQGVCHDDWPAGNTLSYLVKIYRTLDSCPVDYHRQTEVFYMFGRDYDRHATSACVRPVGSVTCNGVIDPAYGTPATQMHTDFDWMYSVLSSAFKPFLMQADICQDPANNNTWVRPLCPGATPSMVTLFGVGLDRCAYIEL
jgi:hypothetical protein